MLARGEGPRWTPAPAQIGPYRVLGILGSGGMGSVFKAESAHGEVVALKMIGRVSDAQTRFRPGTRMPAFDRSRRLGLVREARLAMELIHPNIVRVFDYGQHGGRLYVVMEFLEGQMLLSAVRDQQPTLPQRLLWLAQVCDALSFAHHRGVIHRDLHSNNVLVLRDQTIKLLDFGLARRVEDTVVRGQVAGVLPLLAPEILRGKGRLSPVTDIWSVGVLLSLLLQGRVPSNSGQRPFADNPLSVPSRLLDPASPCRACLQNLLSRALEPDPDRRLSSAREFAAELRQIAATAELESVEGVVALGAADSPLSLPLSAPLTAQPASTFVRQRKNRPRSLVAKLASFDVAQYLKTTGLTLMSGLMVVGYLQSRTEILLAALACAAALALLPICLLFPANLLLAFAAEIAESPRCRSCRAYMQLRSLVTRHVVNDTALSLGMADSVAALEAGLWEDAGRLLSLHGQEPEPMLPRQIADAPLRLHLRLFRCPCCPEESAIFNVQEHRDDRWVTRPNYVKAYRLPQQRQERPVPYRLHLRHALPPILYGARAAFGLLRISVVQWVCAAGLLFMVWFTWAYLHNTR